MPILAYQLQNSTPSYTLTNDEKADLSYIFQQNNQLVCNNTYDISHKSNIVIMLMESLNTACISPKFMPNLYALSQKRTTLCCTNVNQLSHAAASIGGQLVTLTGLSGLRQSVFVTDYPLNRYPSIVTELANTDNYHSYTVISTHRHYWRQHIVCQAVGMSNLFEQNKNAHNSLLSNVWGWDDDKIVLEKALNNIPTDNRPFCVLIVPGNMHAPYDVRMTIDCDAKFDDITDPALHEYMRRARYLDDQIAAFIQELKNKGLYEDTLIVVTSDHQVPNAYCSDAMRESLSPYIPAIFINTGADWTEQNKRNKDVVFCHSQVYPTMLQLMGLRPEKYAGLFPPMTNIEATQEYDFANCAYETTTDKRIKQIYDIEEKIIRSSYFGVME
jgi:phosphoglycerol transferase MdoB-like AlkP superfamily enzyme